MKPGGWKVSRRCQEDKCGNVQHPGSQMCCSITLEGEQGRKENACSGKSGLSQVSGKDGA